MSSHYETLGVSKTATQDEIKQAYKKLAKQHHPDKGGDTEVFQKIQTAYDNVGDPEKRAAYDNPIHSMFGEGGFPEGFAGGFPGGFPGFPAGFGFGGGDGFDFADIDRLFRRKGKQKVDQYYNIKVTLYDVYFGLKKTLNIKHEIKCEACNKKCDVCKGFGKVKQRLNMGMMQIIQEQPCQNCNGYGIVKDTNKCSACDNKGVIIRQNKIEINVPRGVEDGLNMKFEGLGEQPKTENEVAGDLIVVINVEPGVLFKRDGLNLIYEVNITFKESVVGKTILIPHFEKEITVDTKKFGIINPNKKYVIDGKGLVTDSGNKGHLYLKFNIKYDSKVLSEETIKVLNNIL